MSLECFLVLKWVWWPPCEKIRNHTILKSVATEAILISQQIQPSCQYLHWLGQESFPWRRKRTTFQCMLHALHGRAETSRGFGMTQTNSWHLWLFPCGSFAGTSHHLFKFFLKEISSQFTLQNASDSFRPCYVHKEFVQDFGSPEFHKLNGAMYNQAFGHFLANSMQVKSHSI